MAQVGTEQPSTAELLSVISVKPSSKAAETIRAATDLTATVAPWLQADHDNLTGKVLRFPERSEISAPVQEQLIVELYSK